MWSILTPYLIGERTVKALIVLVQVLWHVEFRKEWLDIFNIYDVNIGAVTIFWQVDTLSDYFMLRRWKFGGQEISFAEFWKEIQSFKKQTSK